MKIINFSVSRVEERGLRKIEFIGKVCTRKEQTIKSDTAERFVYNRIKDGHTAILEHEYVYFDVSKIDHDILKDFCSLSPYIRFSYNCKYIGFSYRFFIDIIGDSRRTLDKINKSSYEEDITDMFCTMLLLTPEFHSLMFDEIDIRANIDCVSDINRVYDEEILNNAPEIFNVTFKIGCDRGITHELVRHKEMSFMQESTRYCNYSKDQYDNSITVTQPEFGNFDCDMEWADAVADAEAHYMQLLKYGSTAQLARSVLPHSTHAFIYISGTLDMWIGEKVSIYTPKLKTIENKGFLPLRDSKFAHPQMIPIAKEIDRLLKHYYSFAIDKIQSYGGKK